MLNRKKGEFVTLLEVKMDALGSKNKIFESWTGCSRLFRRKMKHMSNHCHTLYKYKGYWTERLNNKDSAFTYCTLGAFTASAKSRVYSLITYISTKEQWPLRHQVRRAFRSSGMIGRRQKLFPSLLSIFWAENMASKRS